MPPRGFECRRCGQCCLTLDGTGELTADDVDRWDEAGRYDIEASVWYSGGRYHAWFDPHTGGKHDSCPWLRRVDGEFSCDIYSLRPEHCRRFPETREKAERQGCMGSG